MIERMPEPRVFYSVEELPDDVTAALTPSSYQREGLLPAYRLPNGRWLYAINRNQADLCYNSLTEPIEKKSFGWRPSIEPDWPWKEWLGE